MFASQRGSGCTSGCRPDAVAIRCFASAGATRAFLPRTQSSRRFAAAPCARFFRFLCLAYCRHRRRPGSVTLDLRTSLEGSGCTSGCRPDAVAIRCFASADATRAFLSRTQSSRRFAAARKPGGSIVASHRFRSRCSFRSLPPLRFIRHWRRSASEPVSSVSSAWPIALHLAQSSPRFATASAARFASLLHTAHFRHWRRRCSGATGGGQAPSPWTFGLHLRDADVHPGVGRMS